MDRNTNRTGNTHQQQCNRTQRQQTEQELSLTRNNAKFELRTEAIMPAQSRRRLRHATRPRMGSRPDGEPAREDGVPAFGSEEPQTQARRSTGRALEVGGFG